MLEPISEPIGIKTKIGRITGKKDIDVFWISNNRQVAFYVGGVWYGQKDGYVIDSLYELLGSVNIQKLFLSSGYREKRADAQSYYDIYDCEWSSLALGNIILHLHVQ